MAIGIIIISGSYVYQRLSNIDEEIKDLHKGLDGLNIWMRNELEKFGKINLNSLSEKENKIKKEDK